MALLVQDPSLKKPSHVEKQQVTETSQPLSLPWCTGPLISNSGTAYSTGHFSINHYFFATTNVGSYTKRWRAKSYPRNFTIVNPQILTYVGIAPVMDINITPQFFYQTTSNQKSWSFGDLPIGLDIELFSADADTYFPGIKLFLTETFPTGPYQRLNPKKLLTDGSGLGAFNTLVGLVFFKTYHIAGECYLNTYCDLSYALNAPISVHGLNVYGGAPGTEGKVTGGNKFQAICSFELLLNKNWGLAIDNIYLHANATHFSGKTNAPVGGPSSEQFSFAPAIEYNFNANVGVIAGCWFTAWGRNSVIFRSGVANIYYAY